jgi:hypothetical protein
VEGVVVGRSPKSALFGTSITLHLLYKDTKGNQGCLEPACAWLLLISDAAAGVLQWLTVCSRQASSWCPPELSSQRSQCVR